MGTIISTSCKCMEKPQEFFIGLGMHDFAKGYQYEMAYCDACKSFKLAGESFVCDCGNRMKSVYNESMTSAGVDEIKCPRCGDRMHVNICGMWD